MNLSQHFALTTANKVNRIVKPLATEFNIKHFRYLKLYNDGSRVLLSNYSDCTKFIYEQGHYKNMWFDGEFPEYLTEGWHVWDVMRTIHCGGEISPLEKEINHILDLYHGRTFVNKGVGFYEIYTFDSNHSGIYQIDYGLLKHFILYFKEQAKKLIEESEKEKIIIPLKKNLAEHFYHPRKEKIIEFLKNTHIKRYYLDGKYSGVYLTAKEARCVYWLIQGKSAEEISMIENNSVRTVECHLENIRKKLNCYKQIQIVHILLEIGFIDYARFFYNSS